MSIHTDVAEKIVQMIIEAPLVKLECPDHPESPCLAVWSANVYEQIGALLREVYSE